MTCTGLTRRLDGDPYGDCIWGIVTGYAPEDAMRIASAESPLVMTRAMGTTNIDSGRFSESMCILDCSLSSIWNSADTRKM